MDVSAMPEHSATTEAPLDLSTVPEMKHTVDTALLIQDSRIHIVARRLRLSRSSFSHWAGPRGFAI
jgi:hypothetical protein